MIVINNINNLNSTPSNLMASEIANISGGSYSCNPCYMPPPPPCIKVELPCIKLPCFEWKFC